jgi:hypothetical protein
VTVVASQLDPDSGEELAMAIGVGRQDPGLFWQYTVFTWSTMDRSQDVTEHLNSLGAHGWELVTVLQQAQLQTFFFKRAMRQGP